MKQLELELKKRILIVESQPEFEPKEGVEYYVTEDTEELFILPKGTFKLICKGSELTELIAFDFVEEKSLHQTNTAFKNYNGGKSFFFAKESFISAIESKGYYWGKNPIDKPTMEKYGYYSANSQEEESGWMYEEGEEKYYETLKEWQEAESRTFNPEKTLIFQIL